MLRCTSRRHTPLHVRKLILSHARVRYGMNIQTRNGFHIYLRRIDLVTYVDTLVVLVLCAHWLGTCNEHQVPGNLHARHHIRVNANSLMNMRLAW